jgi:chemotaxis protein histidine kinase CheA
MDEMNEIIQEFCQETNSIIDELVPILETLEADPGNFKSLEVFGQKVDRIMGAAKSLELNKMGIVTEFCKTISYKTAQSKNLDLIKVVVAFLFDAVEIIKEMIASLEKGETEEINPVFLKTVISRLEFISSKLVSIQRSSVAIDDKELLDLTDSFMKLSKNK